MASTRLEHVNITVKDSAETAAWISRVFGWNIRWQGNAKDDGYTIHIGNDDTYVALYSLGNSKDPQDNSYVTKGGLNHWAVVVDDIEATEERVLAEGFKTGNHADYEPGKRFYFHDADGIEIEVVQYD